MTAGEALFTPAHVTPRFSEPIPDRAGRGPAVYDVTPIGYVAEDRTMSGITATYLPVSECDYTPEPAPPGTEPDPKGGPLRTPAQPAWGPMPGLAPYDASDLSRRAIRPAEPYTTRVILYRPRDMRRFSGNVIIETIHPSNGGTTSMWDMVNRFLASRGDVFIGVQHPRTLAWLSYRWPDRYGTLACDDFSQIWGMVADAAHALKRGGAASPISTPARRAYFTGYSFSGAICTTFAKQHHDVNRMGDGTPVFDGYPIGTGFGPMAPIDAPVMIAANQYSGYNDPDGNHANQHPTSPAEAPKWSREQFDSDEPNGRRRRYEVPGFHHTPNAPAEPGSAVPPPVRNPIVARCMYQWPQGAAINPNVLGRAVYEGIFRNIADWVDHGVVPPRADLIETAGGRPVLDEYGNARGGLRMPDITLPVAAYQTGTGECFSTGWLVPFSTDRLRHLYGSRAEYLRRYAAAADAMTQARFILAERAEQLKRDAAERIPQF